MSELRTIFRRMMDAEIQRQIGNLVDSPVTDLGVLKQLQGKIAGMRESMDMIDAAYREMNDFPGDQSI